VHCLDGRKVITVFARTFIGSHYLWGSGGAFPGQLNGARYRPGSVPWNEASLHHADLSICAAKCDVQGHYVCAGRYEKAGGQVVPDNDVALHDFLSHYSSAALAQWDSMPLRLTPRVVRGVGVPSAGKIVLGENCTGIRHFDCISFINYVLSETTKIPDQKNGWSADIKLWSENGTTDVPMNAPNVAGDILIRYYDDANGRHFSHIAFLDDNGYVVQAQMASAGVHADEPYNSNAWQIRRRLENQFILPDRSNYA
jgi:cell wall-associated NlpC family hydrolase